mmetsp:Transcript_14867/g.28537  ORF Transcript_14867/g.28537 Transcript_14867/m.28537 type:complete len:272 (-) Transcript_14867:153-968(-)
MRSIRVGLLATLLALKAEAYVVPQFGAKGGRSVRYSVNEPLHVSFEETATDIEQVEKPSIPQEVAALSPNEIKSRLLDLLPRMTGKAEEFRDIESYVNALEDKYVPVQTLGFLNMATEGDWQLLFSTNRLGVPNTKLRLRELKQCIATDNLKGSLTNIARWDLAEDGAAFDASGTFSVKCTYEINQGARMIVALDDHVLELAKGSKVPNDVPGLVGMLNRAIPTELFDPNDSAMDTTYLDGDLRIVRLAGAKVEGFRNIFVRSGAVEINPQ